MEIAIFPAWIRNSKKAENKARREVLSYCKEIGYFNKARTKQLKIINELFSYMRKFGSAEVAGIMYQQLFHSLAHDMRKNRGMTRFYQLLEKINEECSKVKGGRKALKGMINVIQMHEFYPPEKKYPNALWKKVHKLHDNMLERLKKKKNRKPIIVKMAYRGKKYKANFYSSYSLGLEEVK